MDSPKHCAVTNGCQKARVSSMYKIAATAVLIARIRARVCQDTQRSPAKTGAHHGLVRVPEVVLEVIMAADCTRGRTQDRIGRQDAAGSDKAVPSGARRALGSLAAVRETD